MLRLSPSERAVAALGRVLSDPDADVRAAAAEALGVSGTQAAVMPLLGHLDDSVPNVRAAVVKALARLGDRRAVVPLIGKVQDTRPSVRQAVAEALGELGDDRASSALVLALRDVSEDVRIAALLALGKLGSDQSVLAITSMLEAETRSPVRAAALDSLAAIGSERGLDTLVETLDSKGSEDRRVAREAIGRVGAKAMPKLEQCLVGQPSALLAAGCVRALGEIGEGVDPGAVVGALRRGVVKPRPALRALARLGDPRGLPTVLEHLFDADPFVRRAAIDAAVELLDPAKPDGRAVEPIVRALDAARRNKAERVALASLLGRTGSPRAVKTLLPLAAVEDDVRLRTAAIEALGLIGPAGQDAVLMEALDAEQASVRLVSAIALRRAASGSSADKLLDRLDRAAEQDRAAIAIALGGALGHSKDGSAATRAYQRMLESRDAERDAMIEAVGRASDPGVVKQLARFAATATSVADRAKVAEALASRPSARETLLTLATDADGSVRANAVWGLGTVGRVADVKAVVAAAADRDVAVAGNAVASLGRIGARTSQQAVVGPLCKALSDSRSYVRANALAALGVAGARCGDGSPARSLLVRDRATVVRSAAAALLTRVPSKDAAADRRALSQCSASDPEGEVAARCASEKTKEPDGVDPVSVYVVPVGESEPAARAPFALVLANGLMRLGLTDRRGAVLEAAAPRGQVRLAVPAPMAR